MMARLLALALALAVLGSGAAPGDEYAYRSWCPMTKKEGFGKGATETEAKSAAYYECVGKGGLPKCCSTHYQRLTPH